MSFLRQSLKEVREMVFTRDSTETPPSSLVSDADTAKYVPIEDESKSAVSERLSTRNRERPRSAETKSTASEHELPRDIIPVPNIDMHDATTALISDCMQASLWKSPSSSLSWREKLAKLGYAMRTLRGAIRSNASCSFADSVDDAQRALERAGTEGSRLIDRKRFISALGSLSWGLSRDVCETVFDSMDFKNTGVVDYGAFLSALKQKYARNNNHAP